MEFLSKENVNYIEETKNKKRLQMIHVIFKVFFWVFNDEKGYESGYKLGATGVMTDCPTLLRKYLRENPQIVSTRKQTLHYSCKV